MLSCGCTFLKGLISIRGKPSLRSTRMIFFFVPHLRKTMPIKLHTAEAIFIQYLIRDYNVLDVVICFYWNSYPGQFYDISAPITDFLHSFSNIALLIFLTFFFKKLFRCMKSSMWHPLVAE